MRLVSWNVARKLAKLEAQAAAVIAREPDVVALQEVTDSSLPLWTAALRVGGLEHIVAAPRARGKHGVLVASRSSGEPVAVFDAPWPQSAVSVDVEGVRVHCVHVPNARNGFTKVETFEAIVAGLEAEGDRPRLLCGDLNTPRRDLPDLVTFAYDRYQRLRPERGERWDAAERALFEGRGGLVDAFRRLHPDVKELSWEWPQWGGGYRLDHLFVSPALEVESVEYRHEWRRAGLSDHSGLEALLTAPGRARRRAPAAPGAGPPAA